MMRERERERAFSITSTRDRYDCSMLPVGESILPGGASNDRVIIGVLRVHTGGGSRSAEHWVACVRHAERWVVSLSRERQARSRPGVADGNGRCGAAERRRRKEGLLQRPEACVAGRPQPECVAHCSFRSVLKVRVRSSRRQCRPSRRVRRRLAQ